MRFGGGAGVLMKDCRIEGWLNRGVVRLELSLRRTILIIPVEPSLATRRASAARLGRARALALEDEVVVRRE